MSKEYKEQTVRRYEAQIENLLTDAPFYIRDFYEHMHNGRREITTQAAYIRDMLAYLGFIKDSVPDLKSVDTKKIPEDIFENLTVKDLNEYRAFLHDIKKISNASIKKKFAAISAFYKYMNIDNRIKNNPMKDFEQPAVNKKRIIKLDASMSSKLLDGILRNDLYLADTLSGKRPLPIPEKVYVKREPLVLRNYAICCLFLGAGLRVSELVGLDLTDINFNQGSLNIIAKGGDEVQVYFGDDVEKALKTYINGSSSLSELSEKYKDKQDVLDWVKENAFAFNFYEIFRKKYPKEDEAFFKDMKVYAASVRRTGRSGFRPRRSDKAVFLSSRGQRMTVRMVELMIKEMVQTYLPEYDDKDLFSPHKLRATCATRILTQTGDIQLASTQLNHKGIAVTAAFYAELQKEKQKDKVKSLDMNKW